MTRPSSVRSNTTTTTTLPTKSTMRSISSVEALEADIDPLDAQSLGHHERDYDLGHEEIHLNLDAADEPANPARETPHSN